MIREYIKILQKEDVSQKIRESLTTDSLLYKWQKQLKRRSIKLDVIQTSCRCYKLKFVLRDPENITVGVFVATLKIKGLWDKVIEFNRKTPGSTEKPHIITSDELYDYNIFFRWILKGFEEMFRWSEVGEKVMSHDFEDAFPLLNKMLKYHTYDLEIKINNFDRVNSVQHICVDGYDIKLCLSHWVSPISGKLEKRWSLEYIWDVLLCYENLVYEIRLAGTWHREDAIMQPLSKMVEFLKENIGRENCVEKI